MKFKYLLTAFLIAAGPVALAQTTITRSSVTYRIKNLGIMTEGKFGGLQADLWFDPAKLDSSTIEASVDVNTIDSDNSTRDRHLKGEKFFYAEQYPRIVLKSVSFQRKNDTAYTGKFNLTIKGITKLVELPFTFTQSNGTAQYKGSLNIKRKDFNIGGSSMVLGDDVTILISAETANAAK